MAISLEKFDDEFVTKYDKIYNKDVGFMQSQFFLRDPMRGVYINPHWFYTPADGFILYQKTLTPNQKLAEIKGVNYTLKDLMQNEEFDKTCMTIGIFMTYYHPHINRIPRQGYLKFHPMSPVKSYNRPMIFAENDLFDYKIKSLYRDLHFLKTNYQVYNEIYDPQLDYTYYVIQTADDEVPLITHFTMNQNDWFSQGERYSMIRWGSQCTLVLPIDKRFKFKTMWPNLYSVEAGIDPLISF